MEKSKEISIKKAQERDLEAVASLYAAREASAQGGKFLRLYVWTENTPAIRAYEKSGYTRLGKEDIGLGEYGLPWFYLYEKRL